MPLPLVLGVAAAAAGAVGAGGLIHGGVKMKNANDTMKKAETSHQENIARFEAQNEMATKTMDRIGTKELEILKSFEKFSDIFERIHNKPEFKAYDLNDVQIPAYNAEDIKKVSVGAGVLLGGLGGAALGTAGGFAAAGATTAAVMAFGTASTGTAITTLSGVAATNATLAALGGGAIAAGGGGIALGTTILGVTTLGVGLLVGGIIFSLTGSGLSKKADEAMEQMKAIEEDINKIRSYLVELSETGEKFGETLSAVSRIYYRHLERLGDLVVLDQKTDWNQYTSAEKVLLENTVLLVNLLFQMCKVRLVLEAREAGGLNQINHPEIEKAIGSAKGFMDEKGLSALA